MSKMDAWRILFNLSSGNNWVKIPDNICKILGIDNRLGILGNMLCTKSGADGIMNFVNRLNKIGV